MEGKEWRNERGKGTIEYTTMREAATANRDPNSQGISRNTFRSQFSAVPHER